MENVSVLNDVVRKQKINYKKKTYFNYTFLHVAIKPALCCGKNETFVKCPGVCPSRETTCTDVINRSEPECIESTSKIPNPNCKPECRCQHGYVRNHENKCILIEHCIGGEL